MMSHGKPTNSSVSPVLKCSLNGATEEERSWSVAKKSDFKFLFGLPNSGRTIGNLTEDLNAVWAFNPATKTRGNIYFTFQAQQKSLRLFEMEIRHLALQTIVLSSRGCSVSSILLCKHAFCSAALMHLRHSSCCRCEWYKRHFESQFERAERPDWDASVEIRLESHFKTSKCGSDPISQKSHFMCFFAVQTFWSQSECATKQIWTGCLKKAKTYWRQPLCCFQFQCVNSTCGLNKPSFKEKTKGDLWVLVEATDTFPALFKKKNI